MKVLNREGTIQRFGTLNHMKEGEICSSFRLTRSSIDGYINKDLRFQSWFLKLIQPSLSNVKENALSYALINITLCRTDKYCHGLLPYHRFKPIKVTSTVCEYELKIKTARSRA